MVQHLFHDHLPVAVVLYFSFSKVPHFSEGTYNSSLSGYRTADFSNPEFQEVIILTCRQ